LEKYTETKHLRFYTAEAVV